MSRTSKRVATLIFAAVLNVSFCFAQDRLPVHAQLTFKAGLPPHNASILFMTPGGRQYFLELLQGWNSDGKPPEVGLTLRSKERGATLQNLLAGPGKCCVSQATFAATQFNDRAHLATTALDRTFHLKRPSLDIKAHVMSFKISANAPSAENDTVPFSFDELTIDVSVTVPNTP